MQAGGPVGEVAEAEGNGDGVEGAVGEGEFHGIGFGQLGKASIPCLGKQWAGEIEAYNLGLGQCLLKHRGDITRAAGEIEDLYRVLPGHGCDQLSPPADVHTQAKETVEPIIAGRKIVEEGADGRRFHDASLSLSYSLGKSGFWILRLR